ncbi:MAG: cysteine desulfurase family protein [Aquabacterium sp.]
MTPGPIYLDHNATTPPSAAVVDAMLSHMTRTWANASSQHEAGQAARVALGQARSRVARMLNCRPNEVVFTSGATEANHMALRGAVGFNGRGALVASAGEHAGVLKLLSQLQADAVPVARIGLRADGQLDLDQARALISDAVSLVSVMAANNETGVLMPIGELARLAHAAGALLHVDATQLVGKLPFDFAASGADLVSVSAHKFHGPKGIGALLVRQGLNWPALFPGAQERGRRAGTENLPGVAGFAAAAEALTLSPEVWLARASGMARLRDRLEAGLQRALPGVVVYGATAPRLPNTSYLRVGRLHADQVLAQLDRLGVMASSGSACSAGGLAASPVLTAMGVPRDEAVCAVRFSLSPDTTASEVDHVLSHLPGALMPLMAASDPVSPPGVFA